MEDLFTFLESEGVDAALLQGVKAFRDAHPVTAELKERVPQPEYFYYGK
jgi:hypothetical protein